MEIMGDYQEEIIREHNSKKQKEKNVVTRVGSRCNTTEWCKVGAGEEEKR